MKAKAGSKISGQKHGKLCPSNNLITLFPWQCKYLSLLFLNYSLLPMWLKGLRPFFFIALYHLNGSLKTPAVKCLFIFFKPLFTAAVPWLTHAPYLNLADTLVSYDIYSLSSLSGRSAADWHSKFPTERSAPVSQPLSARRNLLRSVRLFSMCEREEAQIYLFTLIVHVTGFIF